MFKQLYPPFLLALSVAILGTVFFPTIRLFAFAPFLALVFIRADFVTALWVAAITGLLIDLLSSQMRFGAYSFCYSLTAALVYHQKRHFFVDKPLALSLYTALIASLCSSLELLFLYALDACPPVNVRLFLIDILGMSLLDGVYAFLCFTCPMKIYPYLKRLTLLRKYIWKKNA